MHIMEGVKKMKCTFSKTNIVLLTTSKYEGQLKS